MTGKRKKKTPETKNKKAAEKEAIEKERKEKYAAYKSLVKAIQPGEFILPKQSSEEPLSISKDKFKDLQDLKPLCGPEGKTFLDSLKCNE